METTNKQAVTPISMAELLQSRNVCILACIDEIKTGNMTSERLYKKLQFLEESYRLFGPSEEMLNLRAEVAKLIISAGSHEIIGSQMCTCELEENTREYEQSCLTYKDYADAGRIMGNCSALAHIPSSTECNPLLGHGAYGIWQASRQAQEFTEYLHSEAGIKDIVANICINYQQFYETNSRECSTEVGILIDILRGLDVLSEDRTLDLLKSLPERKEGWLDSLKSAMGKDTIVAQEKTSKF
ncbi:MAG: hypothetical protein RSC68_00070 [Acinetobacter sp.]